MPSFAAAAPVISQLRYESSVDLVLIYCEKVALNMKFWGGQYSLNGEIATAQERIDPKFYSGDELNSTIWRLINSQQLNSFGS
jgi:hypothetical protein